jgi:hypothetical protein
MPTPGPSRIRKKACKASPAPWACIPDDRVLTHQTFEAGVYLEEPRYEMERDISLLTGRLTVEQASRFRRAVISDRDMASAEVRYTTAGRLRSEGFAVVHTPRRVTNGCLADIEHVSVIWPADDPLNRQDVPWPAEVSQRFSRCFAGYEGRGGETDESGLAHQA